MIFWWFFDDFWRFCFKRENQTKPRKSPKKITNNHQKIIVLLEKTWKSKILASFLGLFKKNDDFLIIFWCFFNDFLGFVWFSLLKQNLQKSSKNHQKIIEKSLFCLKNNENLRFWQVFLFFSSNTMILWWFFDDFLGFVWFSLLKQNLQKSSKNHQQIIVLLEKN